MTRPVPARGLCLLRTVLTVMAAATLAACASTTPTPPPPFDPPLRFKEDAIWKPAAGAADAAAPVGEDWWRVFGDTALDDLEARLSIGNNNLVVAAAAVASAKGALAGSRAAQWPELSVSAGHVSSNASTARGNTLQADASWELDLWGRLSGGVKVATANLQASEDDLAAARLSAQATLAQTYFALRTAEAQQQLLQRSLQSFARALELTEARRHAGVAALSDVLQAQTQLESVQAQMNEQVAQRALYEHAIAVLLGQAPSVFSIATTASLPNPPAIPPLLPSTLLERRPDIAAAERKLASAFAQIGVADAARFPQISLSAAAGLAGRSLGSLVSAPTAAWSLGGSLVGALLDGGQRRQASDQARATADQATASYRQTVLTALQEVEDNLVLVDQLSRETLAQRRALDAAQRNLEIVQDQYRAGTVSFLNVAAAQSSALSAEGNLLSVHGRQLTAAGVLLKNIGGRPAPSQALAAR